MLKILMMMRPNARTQRGGDTVVLDRLEVELKRLGHEVTVDLNEACDPADFDITHLYNFCTEVIMERLAKKCVERRAKFVVTTLYEDWAEYFNPMIVQELILTAYVKYGQPRDHWEKFRNVSQTTNPATNQNNAYAAAAAQILVSSGYNESVTLRRDYPNAKRIEICRFASEIGGPSDGGELFRESAKISEPYILCVGRLEQRKNQLSLLMALEDSPLTVVFAAGGFTYEQDYEAACRKFTRKGRNIFLGRVPLETLASVYEGAAAHVLPSWYELPGLVSLEAAARGIPVVVTDNGTIRDYLGDDAHYCTPSDPVSIKSAIDKAMSTKPNPKLKEEIAKLTWSETAGRMVELYEQALSMSYAPDEAALETLSLESKRAEIKDNQLDDFPMLNEIVQERRRS